MSLNPSNSKGSSFVRVTPKAGSTILRNYGIVDLGTQMESFKGQPATPSAKVMFLFETSKEQHIFDEKKGPEALVLFQEYTFIASDRAKLPKVLKAWGSRKELPTELNLKPYLGKYCMATIEHETSKKDASQVYAKIGDSGRSISPVMAEMKDPNTKVPHGCRAWNQDIWFNLDEFSWDTFNKLPKFIQEKIRRCTEWPTIIQKSPEPAQIAQPAAQQQAHNPVTQVAQAAPIIQRSADDIDF